MFGNNIPTSGLTFSKVLSGISKTLNVANQVIPLYQQAKPMINNAKTIMSVLKGLTNKDTNTKPNITKTTNTNKIEDVSNHNTATISNSSPIFFQ